MASDVFDVIIRGETRVLQNALSSAQQSLRGLHQNLSSVTSAAREMGGESARLAGIVDEMSFAISGASAAIRSASIAAKGAAGSFVGLISSVGATTVAAALASRGTHKI